MYKMRVARDHSPGDGRYDGGTDQMRIKTLPFLLLVFCAGCVDGGRLRLLTGPEVDINPAELQLYRDNQDAVVQNLLALAGQPGAVQPINNDWNPVVEAGIQFVQQRCEAYLDAIFWFNRYKNTTVNQINLLGAGTASALGIAQAAARDIALVALAFGITAQSIEILGSSILYKMDPSAVKSLVTASQGVYLRSIRTIRYTTRPAAMQAIQGYLNLCLPPTLEAQVVAAVNNTTFNAVIPEAFERVNAVPEIRQNAPPPSKIETVEFAARAPDRVSLEQILLYNPQTQTYDTARIALMRQCWRELGIPVNSLVDFLAKQEFVAAQRAVVACIQQKLGARATTPPSPPPARTGSISRPPPTPLVLPAPASSGPPDPALLGALEFDPQTNAYGPARITMMRQCWRDLGVSVPAQSVAAFMTEAQFRTQDKKLAACIEQKAAQKRHNGMDPQLLSALKFDSRTHAFDPRRVDLMRQCWTELGITVPGQSVTDFIENQQFRPQDRAVAGCIEKKAGQGG
jgi:hypothetical protein